MEQTSLDAQTASIEELKRAIVMKMPIANITAIIVHPRPHMDEIASVLMLREYGENFFPGIRNASLRFVTQEGVSKLKTNKFIELLNRGYLAIGSVDGPFDDHDNQKEKTSAAMLVARYLEIEKKPELSKLICYADFTDQNGDTFFNVDEKDHKKRLARNAAQSFLPANIMKSIGRVYDLEDYDSLQKAFDVVIKYISFQIYEQIAFEQDKQEIKKNGGIKCFELKPGEKVVFVKSDSPNAGRVARVLANGSNGKTALVIVTNSKNQFSILNNMQNKKNMSRVIREMRVMYGKKKNVYVPKDELWAEGTVKTVPYLHYHGDAQNIYNGSLTQPDVPGLFGSVFTQENILEVLKNNL